MSDSQFFRDALLNASKPVEGCVFILGLMFVWTLAHFTERAIIFLAVRQQTRGFLKESETLLKRGEWKSISALSASLKHSHVAAVYSHCLKEFEKGCTYISFEQSLVSAIRGARISRNESRERLKRGLYCLSAIKTTAPFIGLIGTSIGILDSFTGYAGNKHTYIAFLATNIAEALVPTTMGLLVGVVAMWSFNWQNDRLAVFDTEMEVALLELESILKKQNSICR